MEPGVAESESARLDALRRDQILDAKPQQRFAGRTLPQFRLLNVPSALLLLADSAGQRFKSDKHVSLQETFTDGMSCGYRIPGNELIVQDAGKSCRFANPSALLGTKEGPLAKSRHGLLQSEFERTSDGVYVKHLPGRHPIDSTACDTPVGANPQLDRGSETVILVEDQDIVRRVVCDMLQGSGYRVLSARLPADALLLAEQHAERIALLITDVVMPQMSGPELASAVTSSHPETKVLFMSGQVERTMRQHAELAADSAFIQKPFTQDALLRKVREVLNTPSNRTQPSQ